MPAEKSHADLRECESLLGDVGIPVHVTRCRNAASADLNIQRMQTRPAWTFLSNHSHVLITLAGEPELRLRDIAQIVGITERAIAHILADLEQAGVIARTRVGRRNAYTINGEIPLRHPVEAHRTVNDILSLARKQTPD